MSFYHNIKICLFFYHNTADMVHIPLFTEFLMLLPFINTFNKLSAKYSSQKDGMVEKYYKCIRTK